MNKELIDKLKNGTPLYYDINNLELLKKVLKEAAPNDKSVPMGGGVYYHIYRERWGSLFGTYPDAIKISDFLESEKGTD